MARLLLRPNPTTLRSRILVSLLLSAALIYADRTFDISRHLASLASLSLQPVHRVAAWPGQAYDWLTDHLRSREQWHEQQVQLEQELLRAQIMLHELTTLEEENHRLRMLTDLPQRSRLQQTLIAEVVAVDSGGFRQQIIISRGSYHGIHTGQPVLDTHGVVGQVSRVGLFRSTVLLVTDNAHSMLLQNQRTQEMFLAYGDQHQMLLPHVPWHSDLQVGDRLHTTGLDETFPDNFPVGTVAEIEALPEQDFRKAQVQVSARLQRNREVLLAWMTPPDSLP